jgi:hypothetical protein
MTMLRSRLAALGVLVVGLAVCTGRLAAEDPKGESGKGHGLEALSANLGLSSQQRQEIHTVQAE